MKHKKIGEARKETEVLEFGYDKNDLYQFERMSLEEAKEKIEWHKREFEYKQKSTYGIENQNDIIHIHYK